MYSISTEKIDGLSNVIATHRKSLDTRKVKRDVINDRIQAHNTTISSLISRIDNLKLIEAYLSQFADERQAQVFKQIESTVTEGLRYIFQEDIRLDVSNKLVGSRSEVVFSVISETEEGELKTGVMDARGGGVAAIVGFLTQAVLILLTPGLRPFMALDETFRNVSSEYQEPLGQFVSDLCSRTGLQVLLVTHQPEIAEFADAHYAFTQSSGLTHIKKVK